MTREEQRQLKEQKRLLKIKEREEKKQAKKDHKLWQDFERRMKDKGAWIEEPKEDERLHY